jgi:hypothetical protein
MCYHCQIGCDFQICAGADEFVHIKQADRVPFGFYIVIFHVPFPPCCLPSVVYSSVFGHF